MFKELLRYLSEVLDKLLKLLSELLSKLLKILKRIWWFLLGLKRKFLRKMKKLIKILLNIINNKILNFIVNNIKETLNYFFNNINKLLFFPELKPIRNLLILFIIVTLFTFFPRFTFLFISIVIVIYFNNLKK